MMNFLKKIKALFTKSDVEKTSLQKTARISIIFACIALVGVIVYFALIAPLLKAKNEYIPELFDGEVYQHSSIYILPVYERSQIKSVEIKNALDHYKLNSVKRDSGEITFEIEGSEHISIDANALSVLLADVRVLITNSPAGQERVTATATQADLANYGLDEASDPAWFEVSLVDGSSYRIYVGKSLVTTTGYYVRLEGRKNVVTDEAGNTTEYDIVYALQSSLSETVLKASTCVVSTNLTPYVGDHIFSASNFAITRMNGTEREVLIRVGIVADQGIAASAQMYQMLYPKAYVINEDVYSESILMNLAYVQAFEIVAYGDKIHDAEVYEKFGLDLAKDRLDLEKNQSYATVTFTCPTSNQDSEETPFLLYFSEKKTDLDGTEFYYVYSPTYEIVGKVLAETYGFVDWKLANFTSPSLFYEYFTSAEIIEIYNERENLDLYFQITGKERSRHVDVMTSSSGGKEKVYTTVNGEQIPLVYDTKYVHGAYGTYEGDFEIFRDLYYVLITRKLALYAEIDESQTKPDMSKVVAKLAVTTSPKDHPISYHQYDANGQRLTQTALRDEGGNILCSKVTVPSEIEGGAPIVYDRAYYDIQAKRFFLKTEDPNDGNIKPNGFEVGPNGTVKPNLYLKDTASGEYVETTYIYEFYDMYDTYVNANGETVTQLNPTYMCVVPSKIIRVYSLTSNGERELLSEEMAEAEAGVYIRTATINKLFSDTHKLLRGEQIDKMGVN
ncbi:MAG: DUF4340 domain-containing protein [Clostridia bacterium]|nr:DUF4340 domain-containing protein [Clostridia bacterium]MBR6744726.1 DUF4340 domain-containing protein [Clostridia bacterium]